MTDTDADDPPPDDADAARLAENAARLSSDDYDRMRRFIEAREQLDALRADAQKSRSRPWSNLFVALVFATIIGAGVSAAIDAFSFIGADDGGQIQPPTSTTPPPPTLPVFDTDRDGDADVAQLGDQVIALDDDSDSKVPELSIAVLVALIGVGGTIVNSWMSARREQKRDAAVVDQLEVLTKRLDLLGSQAVDGLTG